jgi:hypothetical protein
LKVIVVVLVVSWAEHSGALITPRHGKCLLLVIDVVLFATASSWPMLLPRGHL